MVGLFHNPPACYWLVLDNIDPNGRIDLSCEKSLLTVAWHTKVGISSGFTLFLSLAYTVSSTKSAKRVEWGLGDLFLDIAQHLKQYSTWSGLLNIEEKGLFVRSEELP